MNEEVRIIKKYTNRRLYDMTESCYITMNDIKNYVIANINFEIRDAKTNQNLTNAVLLQVILEEENFNKPIFTTEILKNFIRFYGNPSQQAMSDFLAQFTNSFNEKIPPKSMDNLINLTQQNMEIWNQSVEKFFAHMGPKTAGSEKKPNKNKGK
ncbi:MAG: polyhydroxyalkanoate synthesis regulator DNA-binding domain-containing protein [Gammaproteobacteria bacterium]